MKIKIDIEMKIFCHDKLNQSEVSKLILLLALSNVTFAHMMQLFIDAMLYHSTFLFVSFILYIMFSFSVSYLQINSRHTRALFWLQSKF